MSRISDSRPNFIPYLLASGIFLISIPIFGLLGLIIDMGTNSDKTQFAGLFGGSLGLILGGSISGATSVFCVIKVYHLFRKRKEAEQGLSPALRDR